MMKTNSCAHETFNQAQLYMNKLSSVITFDVMQSANDFYENIHYYKVFCILYSKYLFYKTFKNKPKYIKTQFVCCVLPK